MTKSLALDAPCCFPRGAEPAASTAFGRGFERQTRLMGMTALFDAFPLHQAVAASEDGANWPIVTGALAFALLISVAAILRLTRMRNAFQRAHQKLQALTLAVKAQEHTYWKDTGVVAVDAIAQTIQEFDRRLCEKRQKLSELNDLLAKKTTLASPPGVTGRLHAILDAVPVGILIAEAPSGRIVEGNHVIEAILRHPVLYSENTADYDEWKAFHEDGQPVAGEEYPLARALAGEDHPTLECRYARGDGGFVWINIVGAPIRDEQGAVIGAIVAVTDINDVKTAEMHRRIMNLELHHRVNNSLAMIQGIANITARTARDFSSFRTDFSDRVQCLSRISTILAQSSWERTSLRDLIGMALESKADDATQIALAGEDVELRSEVALALGVALHELLSNAERHGALSRLEGRVTIGWRIEHDRERPRLILDWAESGGPAVQRPQRTGVGHFLLTSVLARQMRGDIALAFQTEGLHATISAEI